MSDRAARDYDSSHATAWLLVGALAFVLVFPWVVLRGMSLDGVIYATVARNMAEGIGDLWHPIYQETEGTFYEHPPLGYAIQSLAFRAYGDRWWVDRLYSTLTVLPLAWIMVLIWRQLVREAPDLRRYGWLPVALWVFMPAWPWIYRNNYLENVVGIFTALAVYGGLRAVDGNRWWCGWTALAGVSTMAAFLCKGPVGFFPAVTPAIAWLTLRSLSFRKGLAIQLALGLLLAGGVGLLLATSVSGEFLRTWFDQQVVRSVLGQREITHRVLGHFGLPWVMLQDFLPSALLAAGCVAFARRRGVRASDRRLRPAAWFALATAASASLPIMISPKQSGYYAAPSWPFYMLALALWCGPAVAGLGAAADADTVARAGRWLRRLAVASVAVTIALSPLWAGMSCRDQQLIEDVQKIGPLIGPHGVVNVPADLHDAWSLRAYLKRMYHVSTLVGDFDGTTAYHIDLVDRRRETPPPGCTLEDLDLNLLLLYKRAPATATPSAEPPRR